jgi:shikimate kinase
MPGSGKTSLGRQLAEMTGVPFYDLDNHIETSEGATIAEIFEAQGEDQFRYTENKYLLQLIALPAPKVVALGGGTPCFFNNIELIRVSGTSVYLKVPIDTLVERLLPEANIRPLLKGKDAEELPAYLQQLFERRDPFYRRADHTLEGNNIQPADIIKIAG